MLGAEQGVHLTVVEILPPQRCIEREQVAEPSNIFRGEPTVGQLAEELIEFTLLVLAVNHAESVRPSF